MSYINIFLLFVAFGISLSSILLAMLANRSLKKSLLSDATPINFGVLLYTIIFWLNFMTSNLLKQRLQHVIGFTNMFILIISSGLFIYSLMTPIFNLYLKKIVTKTFLLSWIIFNGLAVILTHKDIYIMAIKVIQQLLFLIVIIAPVPFIFRSNWKKLDLWVRYKFIYPLVWGASMCSLLANHIFVTVLNVRFSIFSLVQLLLFISLSILIILKSLSELSIGLRSKIKRYSDYNLTKREIEVIELLLQAKSYKQIAEALFISTKTVNNHIYNIYRKCNVQNKTELNILFNNN